MQLIVGQPTEAAGTQTTQYAAAQFAPDEGWRLQVDGNGGGSSFEAAPFVSISAARHSVGIAPADARCWVVPVQIRIRVRGSAPGHPVRLLDRDALHDVRKDDWRI